MTAESPPAISEYVRPITTFHEMQGLALSGRTLNEL
jgi:hypothetical protein